MPGEIFQAETMAVTHRSGELPVRQLKAGPVSSAPKRIEGHVGATVRNTSGSLSKFIRG